ncbi:hypothetical protein GWI33_014527 [Rhynchophorus ferrugineus]|uniref:ABC-type glutathione-S-conjugate transporter n=1 Tax=Rhynchophorus ferrugineus TaxID=354439 RepID=A0A834MAL0_RHYFE|nr:hypothetical protein GWI33_014527 [Rhynchophorus ferrugineus]
MINLDNEDLDRFCGSKFWDYNLTWNSSDPDFTPCFEKTALVWLPCVFLWLFAPLEVYYMKSSRNKDIPWNWKNVAKVFITGFICIISLSDFLSNINEDVISKVAVYMPFCKLITFTLAGVLAYYNKNHGVQSSGLLFIFWFLMALFGIPQFRTEIKTNGDNGPDNEYLYISYMIYYPLTIAMFLLNCFAEGRPRIYPYGESKKQSPLPSASFLSKITYCYMDKMMYKGFRRPLEEKDMWDLKPEDRAGELVPIFEREFFRRMERNNRKHQEQNGVTKVSFKSGHGSVDLGKQSKDRKETSIIPAMWSCFHKPFMMGVMLKLITDLSQFINPQILGLLIAYVGSNEPMWKGILYALALFISAGVVTLINNQNADRLFIFGLRVRTVLTSAIYRKSLRISNSARKQRTVGEIVNLMSADANKFQELTFFINMLWSAPVTIVLAIYFLWLEVGPSILAGLLVMILLIPLNMVLVSRSKKLQIKQMKEKDERVKIMNEVLNGMKILKLYAWEQSFEEHIMGIRNREITSLRQSAYLHAGTMFIWNCAPFLVSCATFATYVLVDEKNILTPAKAFVSLALLNILRMPMSMLPNVINQMVQTWVSVRRLNAFLNAEELEPYVTHDKSDTTPLKIDSATFSWGEEPVLKNIDVAVAKNSLTAVVGAVGSGKSSLVSAFLGEMDKLSGRVNNWGSIAYVPQQAWIQNATVRDNITFGREFDKIRYNRVVEACALKPDFEMLANGDQTEIGEKGINLSGGQKQRISLARAVYVDADIYLLDDPLSAVDSHVGKHIFEKLIGPSGLLRNKTRVLVTHAVTYLPQTDKIVVLKDGEISESGSYQDLLAQKGAFADFLLQHINEDVEDEEELDELQEQLGGAEIAEEVRNNLRRSISRQRSRISESSLGSQQGLNGIGRTESRESLRSSKRKPSVSSRKISIRTEKAAKSDTAINQKGKLIQTERAERGNVKFAVYLYYLGAVGTLFILGTIAFNAGFQGFGIATNFWLGLWSEDPDMIDENGKVNTGLRNLYLIVYAVLGIGQAVCIYIGNMLFAKGTTSAAAKLHNFVLHNVLRLPMSFFDTTPSGRILSRFAGDIINVDLRLPMNFNVFFLNSIKVIGTLAVICYTTPLFTAVIIPIACLYLFIQRYYVATSRQLKRIESVSRSPIYSHFGETVTGTHVIRAFGQTEKFMNDSDTKVDKNQMSVYPSNCSGRWLSVRLEMIGNIIILFAALFAVLGKDLNPALVGLSVSYSMNITQTLNFLVRMVSDVETTIVCVERIKEYGEVKREADWEIPSKKPLPTWPESGTVQFKRYGLRYRPGLDLVLKGIDFQVNGGEKIGIVGRTGAGKSSLTLALFRIIEAAEGTILIDGTPINEIGLHDLRSRLTIIPQDAVLFSGSLRMNLDPFNKYTDSDVWKTLELAHLKEYVNGLPAGLMHKISEGGENLSVGQRQLICLARALLRKTKILILDEATAAVDLETDELIQKTIRSEFADCTVLTIAHRLNTIMDSDRVLVLDKGNISEFDTPANLLENKDSIFHGMCKDAGLV